MALTNTQVDAAVPVSGQPSRSLLNAALKQLIVDAAAGGGGGGGSSDLTYTAAGTQGTVSAGGATNAVIPAADSTNAGLFLPAEKSKLAGIEVGATVDQTGSEMVTAINAALGSTAWQTGGASVVVEEGDSTVVASCTNLDFASADFDVTAAGAEANISLSANIPRILAPVTLSTNTSLTAASHGNRTIYVDTAGLTLTINNDATGGWTTDDALDIQAIGSGTFTLVQGTATLTTDSGTSADSTTAVAKRVQAARVGTSAWRTISPSTSIGGSGILSVVSINPASPPTAPTDSNENTLATLNLSAITGSAIVEIYTAYNRESGVTGGGFPRLYLNGTLIHAFTLEDASTALFTAFEVKLERVTDTTVRVTPNYTVASDTNYSVNAQSTSITVSSLSAGASLEFRLARTGTLTRVTTLTQAHAKVMRY